MQIGVIGSAGVEEYPRGSSRLSKANKIAENIGKLVAQYGGILICGGKGGVMEYACRGAKKYGGLTVGIVKNDSRGTANKYVDVEIVSNMNSTGGESLLIASSDGIIAIGGGSGTLQELAIAYRKQKPIVALTSVEGWAKKLAGKYLDERMLTKIEKAENSNGAIKMLLEKINKCYS
ncbi:MAG TPA: TIGR00725 family protein [Patescibacteria group bacterium]|nr:TIGR00725 family protein [Patescibacteria group bacterium]